MLLLDYERGASPLYSQIMREEKRKIVEGEYLFGQVVPSEKDMEEMYHVSRITVRQAIQGLERDGYVKRIRGKGTQVVYRHQIEEMLLSINSFSEEMRERGMEPGTKYAHIDVVPATPDLAALFNCEIGAQLYRLDRIRTANSEPFVIFTTYCPMSLPLPKDDSLYYGSFYALLKKIGVEALVYIEEMFSADIASGDVAQRLEMQKGRPIMIRIVNHGR